MREVKVKKIDGYKINAHQVTFKSSYYEAKEFIIIEGERGFNVKIERDNHWIHIERDRNRHRDFDESKFPFLYAPHAAIHSKNGNRNIEEAKEKMQKIRQALIDAPIKDAFKVLAKNLR